jgi:glutathione peroxidase
MSQSIYNIPVKTIDGNDTTLESYRGKVLLVVNVASKCGFTPQYEGLEQLYRRYRDRGLAVLGFPCNQFAGQEPGSEAEIQSFCRLTYDVSFPLFGKIAVNGKHTHELYRLLKEQQPGMLGTEAIKWNFTKFLVGRDGRVLARFAPQDTPESLGAKIEAALSPDALPRDPTRA